MTSNPYDELGVGPDAPIEEIRRAYLRAARDNHPDRHAGSGPEQQLAAEERMRRINAAWRDLSDVDRRRLVDRRRAESHRSSFAASPDGELDDLDDDEEDIIELIDDGAPLPSGARLATALGPVLLLAAAGLVLFGLFFVSPLIIAIGFATGAVAVTLFLAAPLLAMGDARRNG